MTTDIFKSVSYSVGEGLSFGDFNDAQGFLAARFFDQMLASTVGGLSLTGHNPDLGLGMLPPDHLAYALNAGAAYLTTGSAPNKIKITSGTLLQRVGTPDGNASKFIPYTFTGAEEFTIAAGSGTNPRVDLLQMKLETISGDTQLRHFKDAITGALSSQNFSKKQSVQCTLSVKSGTPAANPVYPDPDTGYVAVGGVVVNATYSTATTIGLGNDSGLAGDARLHDQRMPVSVRGYRLPLTAATLSGSAGLTSGGDISVSGGTGFVQLFPPVTGAGRIVGTHISYTHPGTPITVQWLLETQGHVVVFETTRPASASMICDAINYADLALAPPASSGSTPVQPSATHKIGSPLWTNGRRCLFPRTFPDSSSFTWPITDAKLWFPSLVDGSIIHGVHVFVAGGL